MTRYLFGLILAAGLFCSCKKAIEQKKEDLVLDAMTNGQWYVYSFQEAGVNLTPDFAPYSFQFYRDGRVDALTPAGIENQGNWEANVSSLTIESAFPDATDPIRKLNAVWKLVDNSWTYVKAETTVDGLKRQLHLKKK